MPFCAENVCLEVDNNDTGLYAVGSRSHVTMIDSRTASSQVSTITIRSPDKDCGVRSIDFNSGLLSMGTGAGNLYFYDLRARSFLVEDEIVYKKCVLHSTPGWLVNFLKNQLYTISEIIFIVFFCSAKIRHIGIFSAVFHDPPMHCTLTPTAQ